MSVAEDYRVHSVDVFKHVSCQLLAVLSDFCMYELSVNLSVGLTMVKICIS